MTAPQGPHWILTHPDMPHFSCLLTGREVAALWDMGLLTTVMDVRQATFLPLAEFLADVRKHTANQQEIA